MIKTNIHKHTTWIDLESPTESEVLEASKLAEVDPSVTEDLLTPTSKHKLEFGENHAYLVLHFPSFQESRNGDAAFEVDFLITKSAIITTHYSKLEAFENFVPDDSSELGTFSSILGELLSSLELKLSGVDHKVRDIEKRMFSGHEKEAVFALSEASRHLTDFKKITAGYPETLSTLEEGGEKIFGKRFAKETRVLSERTAKISNKLSVLSEWTSELRETVSALLTIKQNTTMLTLTVFTVFSDILIGGALIYLALHGH